MLLRKSITANKELERSMSSREIEGCGSWKLPSKLQTISQDQPEGGRIARVSRDQDVLWRGQIYARAVRIGPLQPRSPIRPPEWLFPLPQRRTIEDAKIELGRSVPPPERRTADDDKIEDGMVEPPGSIPLPERRTSPDEKIELGGSVPLPERRTTEHGEIMIPLFTRDDEKTKLASLRSLILRGHAVGEEPAVVLQYLQRIQGRISAIIQRYESPDQKKCDITSEDLVEMMVLDGCFIIEVVVDYWMRKREDAIPHTNEFVRMDLLLVDNQIPFFVLEELFRMTVVPELGVEDGGRELLRNLSVFYLTMGAIQEVPAGYNGPIYHLLHLLHISLRPLPRPIAPKSPLSLSGKLTRKMKLLWRVMDTCSSNLPVDWVLWHMIPPARELSKLGVRFKPKLTPRLVDITFDDKNGVLEIPRLPCSRIDMHMVANQVAMEMGDGWVSTERLFCSYAMFMTELISGREDATLLINEGILKYKLEEWSIMMARHFGTLAHLNVGGGYQGHFKELAHAVNTYYIQASKTMRAMCGRSGHLNLFD